MIKIVDGVEIKLSDAEIAAFNARQPTETQILNEKWQFVRIKRNDLLAQSDWIVIKEREEGGSVSNFADWKKYRQELRDITKTYKSLDDVKWPEEPSS